MESKHEVISKSCCPHCQAWISLQITAHFIGLFQSSLQAYVLVGKQKLETKRPLFNASSPCTGVANNTKLPGSISFKLDCIQWYLKFGLVLITAFRTTAMQRAQKLVKTWKKTQLLYTVVPDPNSSSKYSWIADSWYWKKTTGLLESTFCVFS